MKNLSVRPKENSEFSKLLQDSNGTMELLREGQECPFCHFSNLKKNGDEVTCPVCGYGHRVCT